MYDQSMKVPVLDMRIDEFVERCSGLRSDMLVSYKAVAPSLEFSNTGRRGGRKYFSVTLRELTQALQDILDNYDAFEPHTHYVEGNWRDLFSSHLTDSVTNALSTVQTLPLFSLITKTLVVVNGIADYEDKEMPLSRDNLSNAIAYLSSQCPDDGVYLSSLSSGDTPAASEGDAVPGKNVIFYGAPGTGKSHSIKQLAREENIIRTVFHPDTQYSDFVGCLKPVMQGSSVGYEFRPGPFTEAVIKAVRHPGVTYCLVVEEINRAAAAAVFGEIFQLLDREADGCSTYSIDVSDPDMLAYLNGETANCFSEGKLSLPSNLSIYATMNSSDQAVMPMDTAFKRRWQFEYLQIDYANASPGVLEIPMASTGSLAQVPWAVFAQVVNERLASERIPEDRLLGHRFLSETELASDPVNALKGKLFMYLWDDVLRHGQHSVIFRDSISVDGELVELTTFGQLVSAFERNEAVFNDDIESRIAELSRVTSPEPEPEPEEEEVPAAETV